jgi:hypothetical protein
VWINQRLKTTLELELIEKDSGPALQSLVLEGVGVRGEVRRDCDSSFINVCTSCGQHEHKDLLPADVDSDAELVTEQLSRFHGSTLYSHHASLRARHAQPFVRFRPAFQGVLRRRREKMKPWLHLARISNLPTVWTNVTAAWLLAGGTFTDPRLYWLILAGSLALHRRHDPQ